MKFEKARELMIKNQLIPNDINKKSILDVFNNIKKENFLPENFKLNAYIDNEIYIDKDNSYLSNLNIARLIKFAEFSKYDKILHIGALTGYVTSLISNFVSEVIALEKNLDHFEILLNNIKLYNLFNVKAYNLEYLNLDQINLKYDVIIIDSIVDMIPEILFKHLNTSNGRILTIKKINNYLSKGIKITLNNNNRSNEIIFDCHTDKEPIIKSKLKFVF